MENHEPQATDHGAGNPEPGTLNPERAQREAGLAERLAESTRQPGEKTYRVKAIWKTLQGEGFHAGRPAVFVRLVACNMWTGYETDRQRDAARTGADCPLWCFSPETPVLMADYTTRPISKVEIGEWVMGAEQRAGHVRLVPTVVRNKMRRAAPLAFLRFNNTTVVGTADHSILTRPTTSRERTKYRPARDAVGRGTYSVLGGTPPHAPRNREFWRGWLGGVAFGDGCFWTLRKRTCAREVAYDRSSPWTEGVRPYRRFRLVMRDGEALDLFREKAIAHGFDGWHEGTHRGTGHSDYVLRALYLTRSAQAENLEAYVAPSQNASRDYKRGFLAGMIDSEGHIRNREVSISQSQKANPRLHRTIGQYLRDLELRATESPDYWSIFGQDSLKLLVLCPPALTRKTRSFDGRSLNQYHGELQRVEPCGMDGDVVNLTTDTGNYIAAGHVVKNCDTDFTKEGSLRLTAADLAEAVVETGAGIRFCVLTGGEPLLQADAPLVAALRQRGVTVACETNGTVSLVEAFGSIEAGPDWVVCSPKLPEDQLKIETCDELKLVVPDYRPEAYAALAGRVRQRPEAGRLLWLQPEDGPRFQEAARLAVDLALDDPRWRVSVQGHKALGVD